MVDVLSFCLSLVVIPRGPGGPELNNYSSTIVSIPNFVLYKQPGIPLADCQGKESEFLDGRNRVANDGVDFTGRHCSRDHQNRALGTEL